MLDSQFNQENPNPVWNNDITYIWMSKGFVYLINIIDLNFYKLIAWTLSQSSVVFCIIDDAVTKVKTRHEPTLPLILNSG
ncbi:hypothetical protein [Vagococcus elongatus]